MKSLLDIQQDLRALEKSFGECLKAIQSISADVDMLRNENTASGDLEYAQFEKIADKVGIGDANARHPICTLDAGTSSMYLLALLNITRLDAEVEPERFVFIAWLLKQSRLSASLADLHAECYRLSGKFFENLAQTLPKELHERLITDALITANITGTANSEIMQYTAELCAVLELDTTAVTDCAVKAQAILGSEVHMMPIELADEILDMLYEYGEYAAVETKKAVKDIIKAQLPSYRRLLVRYRDSDAQVKWELGVLTRQIKKDEIIGRYSMSTGASIAAAIATLGNIYKTANGIITTEIKAPCAGELFRFRDGISTYVVISHRLDDIEDIKNWAKKQTPMYRL